MKNIDKIKTSIGTDIFNYISSLNTVDLQKMKVAIDSDIKTMFDQYDYKTKQKRLDEQWLINYRLS